jgi:hypothetical protein
MKSKKKKSKKAVTRLEKIEKLLSDVIYECSDIEKGVEKNVREVLLSAQSSIGSAINYFTAAPSSEVPQMVAKSKAKPSVKAGKPLTAPAAKKRVLKA